MCHLAYRDCHKIDNRYGVGDGLGAALMFSLRGGEVSGVTAVFGGNFLGALLVVVVGVADVPRSGTRRARNWIWIKRVICAGSRIHAHTD